MIIDCTPCHRNHSPLGTVPKWSQESHSTWRSLLQLYGSSLSGLWWPGTTLRGRGHGLCSWGSPWGPQSPSHPWWSETWKQDDYEYEYEYETWYQRSKPDSPCHWRHPYKQTYLHPLPCSWPATDHQTSWGSDKHPGREELTIKWSTEHLRSC